MEIVKEIEFINQVSKIILKMVVISLNRFYNFMFLCYFY